MSATETATTENFTLFDENDPTIQFLTIDVESQTLGERVEGNLRNCYNYSKYYDPKHEYTTKPTGRCLALDECKGLCVCDVDISKKLPNEQRLEIARKHYKQLSQKNITAQSCSTGLHNYCNMDFKPNGTGRFVRVYECEEFSIDVLCYYPGKANYVMFPGSKADYKLESDGEVHRGDYEFVRGGLD